MGGGFGKKEQEQLVEGVLELGGPAQGDESEEQDEQEVEPARQQQKPGGIANPPSHRVQGGEQDLGPPSVTRRKAAEVVGPASNRNKGAAENSAELILPKDPMGSAQASFRQSIHLADLTAHLSGRAATDKNQPLKLALAGSMKLTSRVLDIRLSRKNKRLQRIRRLDDVVDSDLQWVVQPNLKCVEFTLLDRSVKRLEGDVLKLKNKVVFYTSLSGAYVRLRVKQIGVKVPAIGPAASSASYFEELEAEMRLLWEAIMPERPTSALPKEGVYNRYSNRVDCDSKQLRELYETRPLRVAKDYEETDVWQVDSDPEAQLDRMTRPTKVDDRSPDILQSHWKVQSYYPSEGGLWPCMSSASTSTKVVMSLSEGIKVDFQRKVVLVCLESAADKPTEATKLFAQAKLASLLGQYSQYSQQLPDQKTIAAIFATK